ncbi:hypothetical protein BDB00DRAFT_793482 [Zychaea mexicana]|uniref:uncharacterized protein n=1 Tax=Zychaea mexicana TaxID=64656 RepID=UPI0022FF2CAA|nr:uncharacterized protein BDB00DRAFT_793482 [Zychaea mexicana]KAI9473380.1 hypothetical protein BDB00DRAFT_793482 [Zychaea mexicana]
MGHDEKQVPVQHQVQQASVQATFLKRSTKQLRTKALTKPTKADKEHIFNIYRHQHSSLNNSIKDNTELDGLKTNNDHLKLAIESKGVLDHIVRHATSFDPRTDMTLMFQVYQNQCNVKVLSLYDCGLYCLWKKTSLSLPSCPKLLAKDADSWFAILELIYTSAIKLSQQLNQTNDRSYDLYFSRKRKSKAIDYKDWLRGTFFPPDTVADPLILPVPLYDPASNGTEPPKKQKIIF